MTQPRIDTLVSQLLDRGYDAAAQDTLRAIAASTSSGIIAQRFRELDDEADRLAAAGDRLTPSNPVLRALLADFEPVLRRDAIRLDRGALAAQAAGVDAAGTITRTLAIGSTPLINGTWNTPDPEAVNALIGYLRSDAWADELGQYPARVLDAVANQAVRGMVEGWGALRTAREVRRIASSLSVASANNLMRTAQMTSFRDAAAIHQQANADILAHQIRYAALDDRTCLCCIALHGTILPAGERIDDHHQGRCIGIAVARGSSRSVQTGEAWFAALDEEQARGIAGDSAYELLHSRRASLRDFVQSYNDPVWGEMVREASVRGILERAG